MIVGAKFKDFPKTRTAGFATDNLFISTLVFNMEPLELGLEGDKSKLELRLTIDFGKASPGVFENLSKFPDEKFARSIQTFDTREIPVASSPSKRQLVLITLKHNVMSDGIHLFQV